MPIFIILIAVTHDDTHEISDESSQSKFTALRTRECNQHFFQANKYEFLKIKFNYNLLRSRCFSRNFDESGKKAFWDSFSLHINTVLGTSEMSLLIVRTVRMMLNFASFCGRCVGSWQINVCVFVQCIICCMWLRWHQQAHRILRCNAKQTTEININFPC